MRVLRTVALSWLAATSVTHAAAGQTDIPVRPIGRTVAVSPLRFVSALQMGVRQLADGRVLILDGNQKVVLLLDTALANPVLVLDSVPGRTTSFRIRAGAIFAYRGDSTLFVDAAAAAFLVIDPHGKVVRVMPLPSGGLPLSSYLTLPTLYGMPGVDARGRLVFRVPASRAPSSTGTGGAPVDSALLVAFDLQRRTTDTLGSYKIATGGGAYGEPAPALFPAVDDWAVTSEGRVAILRGQDYHIDWLNPDGTKTSAARLPFDWRQLSDADKQRLADSLTADRETRTKARLASLPAGARISFDALGGVSGYTLPLTGPTTPSAPSPPPPSVLPTSPQMLPDYLPPFVRGALRADADGRLWIQSRLATQTADGTVFDVVNSDGLLIDRVQLPEGRTIVGFGSGGTVYLIAYDGGVAQLEKARFK